MYKRYLGGIYDRLLLKSIRIHRIGSYVMVDYWIRVFEFCKEEPGWAIAFFFCGFVIGDTYFVL